MLAQEVIRGPDPERHLSAIRKSAEASFDHVWVHQVGPDQEGFFNFCQPEVLPKLRPLSREPEALQPRSSKHAGLALWASATVHYPLSIVH